MQIQGSGYGAGLSAAAATASKSLTSDAAAYQFLLSTVSAAVKHSGDTASATVAGIASDLQSRLVSGFAAGKDLAGDLTDTVNNALSQVSKALVAKGVDESKVDTLVAKFKQQLSSALDAASRAASGASPPAPQTATNATTQGTPQGSATQVGVSQETAVLDIVTAQGDRVQIRLQEQDGVALNTGANGSTSSSGQALLISSGQVSVAVDGNLNASELEAVHDVLKQVDALAQKFFSGDVQDAFAAASSINADPSEIAQVGLQLSYASAVLVPGAGAAAQPTGSDTGPPVSAVPVQPAPAPATTPTVTAGASTAGNPSTPSQSGAGSSSAAATPATNTAGSTTSASSSSASGATSSSDATSGASASAGSSSASSSNGDAGASSQNSPLKTITGFLQDVLATFSSGSSGSSLLLSTRWKVELLTQSLPAYAPASTNAQITKLGADTLTQLVA